MPDTRGPRAQFKGARTPIGVWRTRDLPEIRITHPTMSGSVGYGLDTCPARQLIEPRW
jgi:hypothetical protein